ncbi:bifunctional alpha/beta hydrolase/OsmC family protein [Actibacterium lipolyticum]|uniref:Alpha/beta hydrolase family protein n=1 Tax=Actibacterium lipolyticum TaxID=1524263 RepID=A0A238KJE4_9RHOB|nr:bifunctional alpha/beta hydrolase/OsmC family protein [Actibacterium lipolyticum]SMX42202.1 Alpha/beta hydrolase family protein [Actibacterium lipolyticum]
MPMEKLMFKGHSGDEIAARLDLPNGPHLGTALFAHCFTCGKDIHAARRIAQRLSSMGFAVLRFDFTGLGHSEGEFENTSFTTNVEDILAAANHLAGRGMAPSLLIGHSLGGAAVLKAAGSIDSVKAVVTIGAPFDPGHVAHNFAADFANTEGDTVQLNLGGQPVRIGRAFLDDVAEAELGPAISNLKRALLVMHAPRDQVVSVDNAAQIFATAKHPKSFVTLDTADHLISNPADAEYAAEVIAAWAARYLGLSAPPPPPGAPEGIVRVSEADPDGFLQDVQSGPHHHALADEPVAYGGTNKGMSPYGYLAAGLGACTSMTIRMYARRKGWPLQSVRVDVSHDKVHAQDAEHATNDKVDRFRREIVLEGDLDDAQRARLLEIADRCPVHQTLERSSHVETKLV